MASPKGATENVALYPSERDIPDDIILTVIEYLSAADILRFSLVSKHIRNLLLPSLYASVELTSNEQCRLILKAFSLRPELAHSLRRLVVHPNHPSCWAGPGSDKPLRESELAASIQKMASAGMFSALQTFKWGGLEAPQDDLWLTLRECCPRLRNIGTTVGFKTHDIKSDSHLFDFRDLVGFSLTTQKSLRWSPFFEGRELPKRLWDMLLTHSPDLMELSIEGTCQTSQLWDIRRILSGRWPRLKSISLGSLSLEVPASDDSDMTSFLSAHPTLEKIEFLSGMYYSNSMFYLPNLARLYSFTGRIQQLKLAPALPFLRCLHFTDWFSPSARFAEMLKPFPHITSLAISVNFLDSISRPSCLGLYERLLSACPQLQHVEISSTGPMVLKDFSFAIRKGPLLQSFVITRTRKLMDEDMTASALRIANQNSELRRFTIRDVMDWDHHDQLDDKYRFKQVGTYVVLADESGVARSLRIHEEGVNHIGRHYTRSGTRDLCPRP